MKIFKNLLIVSIIATSMAACGGSQTTSASTSASQADSCTDVAKVTGSEGVQSGSATQLTASQRDSIAAVAAAKFNADSAYNFVAEQVAFGPRIPGTAGHQKCVDYIMGKLNSFGALTQMLEDDFVTADGKIRHVKNILGMFNPAASSRVMLLAHYDTRPWADQDPDPANHNKPIDGANDGASGVGVMLEIARNIAAVDPSIGVDMLFVDDEDAGTYADDDSWCIGSQSWAKHHSGMHPRLRMAILLDMVGGRDARFHREGFSEYNCKYYNDLVWDAAARAGYADRFVDQLGGIINDDHVSLLKAGIPAIDIIESNNAQTEGFPPTWHTMADNLENIDRQSLGAVGETLMTLLANPL